MKLTKLKANEAHTGFIKTIILIIIGLVLLGAMGFDVRDLIEKPIIKDNLLYGWEVLQTVWSSFIVPATVYIWEHTLQPLINWILKLST